VTSYPEYFFGNIYETDNLGRMLAESPARRKFVERPAAIIPRDCIECDYLSLCHGGCPVRTYTFSGTMFEKDPYCHIYLAMFRKAEEVAGKISGLRALNGNGKPAFGGKSCGSRATFANLDHLEAPVFPIMPSNLVQISRR